MPYPKELKVHCPKYNQNVSIKIKPVTFGADATVCIRFLGQISLNKNGTYTVVSAPAVTGSSLVFMRWFRLFLGQCVQLHLVQHLVYWYQSTFLEAWTFCTSMYYTIDLVWNGVLGLWGGGGHTCLVFRFEADRVNSLLPHIWGHPLKGATPRHFYSSNPPMCPMFPHWWIVYYYYLFPQLSVSCLFSNLMLIAFKWFKGFKGLGFILQFGSLLTG